MATEDDVRAALDLPTADERQAALELIAEELFAAAYDGVVADDSSDELTVDDVRAFTAALTDAIEMTKPTSDVELVTQWMETAARNAAVRAAAPSGATFTWRTQEDDRVRDLHVPMHGVTVDAGKTFDVGGHPLQYPGQPIGPPEVWINCRCGIDVNAGVVAAAAPDPPKGVVVVATPSAPEQYTVEGGLPPDEMHVTVGYFGNADEAPEELRPALESFVRDSRFASHDARVGGVARMGNDDPQAVTLLLESEELGRVRQALEGMVPPDATHPHFTPHMTLGYGVPVPDQYPEAVTLDKLELWWAGEKILQESREESPAPSPTTEVTADALLAVNTHDGPGWLTNPRETERLRNYWARGKGALKIKWGAPGDFDRCRDQLRKYVHNPAYLDGTCANLHYVALGYWPNQGPHKGKHGGHKGLPGALDTPEFHIVAEAFAACAMIAAVEDLPPIEWFQDPGFDGPTPLTFTSDGRVMGHLATWDTCHVGFGEKNCVTAPKSAHDYAYFRTGEVVTSGGAVSVGNITMSTGHAGPDLDPVATVRHYDDTGTVVADVAAGEDDYGIWVAGQIRPGATPEQVRGLRAGALSGDWRRIGGSLELVGALVVNVPGFPIPRPELAASAANPDVVYSLVAAAIVETDPNAMQAELIAVAVVDEVERRATDAARRERASTLVASMRAERARKLLRQVPEKVDA